MDKIKRFFKKLWQYLRYPYDRFMEELKYRKRLKELRKQDPFIYD